jgi:cyanophycinase
MKSSRFFFFLFFLFSMDAAFSQGSVPRGKLFIIGGGSRPPEMINRMIGEAGLNQGGYAIILPMSSSEQDTAIFYAKKSFREAGIKNVYGISCTKDDANSIPKADSILNAKLIYITGGDQSRFMDVVSGSKIEQAIRDAYQMGAMVAGTSAGAAVMSEIMITGNQLKYPEYSSTFSTIEKDNIETRPGLGLVNRAIIDQHFIARSRHNRLITTILEFPKLTGIGIDESTAILVTGKWAEVIGLSQVLVYSNPKRSVRMNKESFGAKGLRLNIYLPGEKFKI